MADVQRLSMHSVVSINERSFTGKTGLYRDKKQACAFFKV